MIKRKNLLYALLAAVIQYLTLTGCQSLPSINLEETVSSPDGSNVVTFILEDGFPHYKVDKSEQAVILPSRLGFLFKDSGPLDSNLGVLKVTRNTFDETWTQPWGEVKEIHDHHNELRIDLTEMSGEMRKLTIIFRAFNDGIAFRYLFPEDANFKDFQITDELTEFALSGDHQSWWIPAFWENRYEYLYNHTPISKIRSDQVNAVNTPFTMETEDGLYLTIHEAALTNYSSMALSPSAPFTLECELFPWSDGTKVKTSTPAQTPWRTIQIAEKPGDLITSYLILNLNEPNVLKNVSWIKPGKYIGIWWGMHIDVNTWSSGQNHGATTENAMRYIDFAAKHDFDGVLIEGWNLGWDGDWTANGDNFSFTEPYQDFDLDKITSYAASKGVSLIGHHETGAAIQNYENQMVDAFAMYQSLGIKAVKTGYVGWGRGIKLRDDRGYIQGVEWHHGQFMVEHYRKVIETASQYQIMLDVHEPIKDTGERRTYPNMMTREGARGQEYDAWSDDGGNPPDHTTILPFTRMMAGPFDLTPGTFDLLIKSKPNNRVNTTLAKQLALYVVIFSPWHMASDLPGNYIDEPGFQFIKDVPTDWAVTRVIDAKIGDYITIVRKERDGEDWYLGAISDENGRKLTLSLDFLEEDLDYIAEIYTDGPSADWQSNPLDIEIQHFLVNRQTMLRFNLAPGGGLAIRFRIANQDDRETIPVYSP